MRVNLFGERIDNYTGGVCLVHAPHTLFPVLQRHLENQKVESHLLAFKGGYKNITPAQYVQYIHQIMQVVEGGF